MLLISYYNSPIGKLLLAVQSGSLAGVWLEGQKYFPDFADEETPELKNSPILKLAREWLGSYFSGEKPDIGALPLNPRGNAFKKEVWEILKEIPYGKTITYGEIANKLAKKRGLSKMSAQAVGGAVGRNPISIIIPCHRVVGASGSLTGYAGGSDKKLWLLNHEGADTKRFFMPKKGTAL